MRHMLPFPERTRIQCRPAGLVHAAGGPIRLRSGQAIAADPFRNHTLGGRKSSPTEGRVDENEVRAHITWTPCNQHDQSVLPVCRR